MRYRIKNDKTKDGKVVFPTPEAIHAELLKRLKVPAHVPKSGDPIQDEPFMDGLGIDWEKEKQTKPWLSNIGFQLDYLATKEKQIRGELTYWRKVNPKHGVVLIDQLEANLTAVLDFQRRLQNRLQHLHEARTEKLNAEINPHATSTPPIPAGFHHEPALAPLPAPPPTPPEPQPVMTFAGDADVDAAMKELGLTWNHT